MNIALIAGQISGILAIAAYIPYIRAVWKKDIKPSRVGWFIWTVLGVLIASSYYATGATYEMWMPLTYAVGQFIVFILSLRHGQGGWTRLDQISLLGAAFGFFAWWYFDSALVGLLSGLFLDFIGYALTFIKTIHCPNSESGLSWTLWTIGAGVNVLAVTSHSWMQYIYPIYMAVSNMSLMLLIIILNGRCKQKHH